MSQTTQGGRHAPPSLQQGQIQTRVQTAMTSPDDSLVIIKVPREGRPFNRENVVDALVDFGFTDFEAVERYARGLEFQVLLEH